MKAFLFTMLLGGLLSVAGCTSNADPPDAPSSTASTDDALREANRAVVETFFTALEAEDMETFFSVWAEDGVQVMPFAPEGFPERLEGIEAIRQQYGGLPENYEGMRFPREIHPMLDPAQFCRHLHGLHRAAQWRPLRQHLHRPFYR